MLSALTPTQAIATPIVGFLVCNKFGQQLFGDNTYLTYQDKPLQLQPTETFMTDFTFRMPILAPAEYSVTVAIAGTPENHVQHMWMHEALVFVSHSSSCSTGLIGIPILNIELRKQISSC